jgi:hypothetical protein
MCIEDLSTRTERSNRAFNKWRKRVKASLPGLSKRVFALRNCMYMGCGFQWSIQWSIEKSLGYVIHDICNFDKYHDISEQIILRVCVEGLYKDVKKAELSALIIKKGGE